MEDNANTNDPQTSTIAKERIDAILAHLDVPGVEINKDLISERFCQMWDFDEGDTLEPDIQLLTTIGLFIYYAHIILDEANVKVDKAREPIVEALRKWKAEEIEKQVAEEKASDNSFKAFVENHQPRVDDIYSWPTFMLDHKRADEKEWTYKMKKCWFSEFLIRFGRQDFIATACLYDQIPANARQDYVKLDLKNQFAKLGKSCSFTYKPVK